MGGNARSGNATSGNARGGNARVIMQQMGNH
jgi:hypothetical protein